MNDSYKCKGLRKSLIKQLQEKGISSAAILQAFDNIPRHFFIPKGFEEQAYKDVAFPIEAEQTISQPYTVAFQTSLLDIKKGDKVLEIGTGSGFQTAILVELGAKVYTIERQKELFRKANIMLRKLKKEAYCYYGDGYKGLPTYSPFDKILITAGAPYIPEALKLQLKVGGILVSPVGRTDSQDMIRLTKTKENRLVEENFGKFVFVPLLQGKV